MKNIRNMVLFLGVLMIILLLAVFSLKFFSFGSESYFIKEKNFLVEVPRFSILESYTNSKLIFKSFRGSVSLNKEIENLLGKYEEYVCRYEKYYYDNKNNITIINYYVINSSIVNKIVIEYFNGKYDNNYCSFVSDPTKLSYQLKKHPNNYLAEPYVFKYKDIEEDKFYNVYYNLLDANILFKTGRNEMNYMTSMLKYEWLSMKTVIDFLEYRNSINAVTKIVDKENEYILYQTKDFSLLKCNTKDGNKDVYIGDLSLKYNKKFCK